MSKLIDTKMLLWMVLSLMVACTKEVDTPSPAPEAQTVYYRACIQTDVDTKAALGDGMAYKYESGDRVYVESEDGSLYGFLDLSDDSGIGKHEAYFEGNLTYVGVGPRDPDLFVNLVLVSGTDVLHTITDGKVAAVTGGSYGQDTWASTLADAVRQLSHFTGSGQLKAKSFTLQQQSSFLSCSVRMRPDQAPVNSVFTAKLMNNNNNATLREVSVTVTHAGTLPFVFAFLGGDVKLENAELVIEWKDSENVDQSKNFTVANQKLAANTYYSISRSTLEYKGFSITAISNGTTIKFNYDGIQYSLDDGESWTDYTAQFTLNADEVACIKGSRTNYENNGGGAYGIPSNKPIFEANKKCYISGNIMSLLADEEHLTEAAFHGAFSKGTTALTYIDINPDNPLILPVTQLASRCYMQMFRNCTSLTCAPQFRVEGTAFRCCYNMFRDCANLTDVSGIELPATTLAQDCYRELFRLCKNLTGAAPKLPAPILVRECYRQMFSDTKITSIICLATDISAQDCLNTWMSNISNSGTFYKAPEVNYPQGASGIPTNWAQVVYTE